MKDFMWIIGHGQLHLLNESIDIIGEVKETLTGILACDWDYGFKIHMRAGGTTDILVPT